MIANAKKPRRENLASPIVVMLTLESFFLSLFSVSCNFALFCMILLNVTLNAWEATQTAWPASKPPSRGRANHQFAGDYDF